MSLSLIIGGCKSWGKFWVVVEFTPTGGPPGTLVTLTGTNYDLSTLTSATIGGREAIILSRDYASAKIFVMPGSTTGPITTVTAADSNSTSNSFAITLSGVIANQQGAKLVGTGNVGAAQQGVRIALSADGNTAIAGGYQDNASEGAAWIFARAGSSWSQQGAKLVGTGNVGAAFQGLSVALSADGNTAIVGGDQDNAIQGAAWMFTRSNNTWSQQGSKLVGTGNIGAANQGKNVALSADGNTAIVGGYLDNGGQGAAWVYTRSGNTWSQQGSKLVGTGNVGAANQGRSVALSADGDTAIVGGDLDNTNQGAAWVFTRTGGIWSQQGAKLVGTGAVGAANQGHSISLSADGNTAIVGGWIDNTNQGAAWVFTRTGGVWSQQGAKLIGTGNTGAANQGAGVALSADGNAAIVGGNGDNANQGATWVYTRTGSTWSQQGTKLLGTGNVGAAQQGASVALSADGNTAIVGGSADNGNMGAAWVWVP